MAFPTISVNSGTGSDNNSGSGGTAITGASATTAGASTTVSLDGSPDLSGVATDGSAAIRITNHGFYGITGVDNGAKTVTVGTAINISTGRAWGIGGKLATLDSATSRTLWQVTAAGVGADTGTGGGTGQWTISLENDETLTSGITMAWTAGTAYLHLKSSVAGTRRTLTISANAVMFANSSGNRQVKFTDMVFLHSNATKSAIVQVSSGTVYVETRGCVFGANDGTNCPLHGLHRTGGLFYLWLYDTAILRCSGAGINGASGDTRLYGCDISRNAGTGATTGGGTIVAYNSIIAHNGGSGLENSGFIYVLGCTIDSNTSDGISSNAGAQAWLTVLNSQITNNGAYGIDMSGAEPHFGAVEYNNFYLNTSGNGESITIPASNLTTDPSYTNGAAATRNYAVGTAMKAVGFPDADAALGAAQSGSTTYQDIGAVQRQEAAAGGGLMTHPGYSGRV